MTDEEREAQYLNQCPTTNGEHNWRAGLARDQWTCAACQRPVSIEWLMHCERKWRTEALDFRAALRLDYPMKDDEDSE